MQPDKVKGQLNKPRNYNNSLINNNSSTTRCRCSCSSSRWSSNSRWMCTRTQTWVLITTHRQLKYIIKITQWSFSSNIKEKHLYRVGVISNHIRRIWIRLQMPLTMLQIMYWVLLACLIKMVLAQPKTTYECKPTTQSWTCGAPLVKRKYKQCQKANTVHGNG